MALFDAADAEMTAAKTGDWWQSNPQRANANFSQIITRPAQSLNEMRARLAPMLSPAGEPGFFQRWVAQVRLSGLRARRLNDWQHDNLLCNPCGEAILAPYELCNLSAFVARATDSPDDLLQATRYAAWLGTLQAQGVHFPSLWHAAWTENAKRERLLGVGFLGYADNAHLRGENVLGMCRATVQLENAWLSERLGAPIASASTAVKPAGNSGLFAGAGSGLHPWHYRYMLRRVTLDDHDPLFQMLRAQHAPLEPSQYNAHQWFLRVPLAAPAGALVLSAVDAVQQLRNLESVTAHYTDHAVSVTVGYRAGEEDAIARYIYEHQGNLVGCTFFRCDVVYPQSPITELTESEYHNLIAEFPQIDWTRLAEYEGEDYTTGAAELACAGGQCEIYGGAAPTAAALCQRRRRGANGGGAVPTAVTL
jgi:ribonucleoside-diphosphate reductase alpha chain